MQTLDEFRATRAHFDASEMEALTGLTVADFVGTEAAATAIPHLYAYSDAISTRAVVIIETEGRFEWGWHQCGVDTSPTLAQAEADFFADRQEMAA